jgi:DNA repair protein SbcD/Mre11
VRILHTADWHLTEKLGSIDRRSDLLARLQEIALYLDEYKVDVMVIAGDIFSQCTRMEDLEKAMADINNTFKPFLLKGGTMVAISGNHDNEHFFAMLRIISDLATPINPGQTGPKPAGRLYLAAQPTILELADRQGQSVQFALLPYPTAKRYLKDNQTHYKSLEEKHKHLHDAMISRLNEMMQRHIKKELYSVLVSHIHVRGSQINTSFHLSESDTIVFDPGEIPAHWSYIAYGHIHKPQTILNAPYMRYAGSIERLNYGEHSDEKSVVLVDIGPQGRREEPICLPLKSTPFYRIEILNPETDMQDLRERYPDHERALVSYRMVYKPGEHNLNAIVQELETIFPRCYGMQTIPEGSITLSSGFEVTAPIHDIPTTVENYIKEKLAEGHPDREDVLKLARELLATLE